MAGGLKPLDGGDAFVDEHSDKLESTVYSYDHLADRWYFVVVSVLKW